MEKKLTLKQEKFIDYYIELGNATEAARKAGYKGKNLNSVASQNYAKLKVYIDARVQDNKCERIASRDEVLRFFTSVLRGKEAEEIPILSGKGRQKLVKKGMSVKDRIKAAENLAKRYGIDKPDDTQDTKVEIILRRD